MKNILVLLFPALLSVAAHGQSADSMKHALGIFGESNDMFNRSGASMSTVGIQYNNQCKKCFGYKLMLGYGAYGESPDMGIDMITGDTARGKHPRTQLDMGIAGAGITFERRFYRKLYFFAGVEVRAGYGHGYIDTAITTQYNIQTVDPTGATAYGTYTSEHDKAGTSASMFYAAFTPSFGLKLNLRRFCIGTELLNYVTFTSLKPQNRTATGGLDFESGNFTQRLFVQYRF